MSALILPPQQLDFLADFDESTAIHPPGGGGFFSLLTQSAGSAKRQRSYKLSDMPQVLEMVDYSKSVWLSQAEFCRPNRRVVNLSRVGLLFADLDTYKSELMAGLPLEQQVARLHFWCDDNGFPRPSIVVFSGRGLQAKWLLTTPLPRAALPRWNACQKALVALLEPLGCDKQARDASRVLRLVDSMHLGSNERVRVLDVQGTGVTPAHFDFDDLADSLLPLTRLELRSLREQRAVRDEQRKALKTLKLLKQSSPKSEMFRGYNGRKLAWDRLEDLRKLGELRGGWVDGKGVSSRTQALHWQLNFMCLSGAAYPGNFYLEANELAKQIDKGWSPAQDELSTLKGKAEQYAKGEKIEFGGRSWPALYTPKNATLVELFGISDEEQKQLKTIISKAEATRRDTARQTAKRRTAGVQERSEYLSKAQERKANIQALNAQGMTAKQIAEAVGVTTATVYNALK
ncbi:helix-turn-helix domain-containing protein [Pseudomonas juntendi]|uniref:Helix-turn-helix domain-containing protein n=1 Tax=Pseudomonas juntendi TaxID=2666183 RepID=A0AAJ5S8H5_9PSED|nr:helix-turn-helix domain-containing protein [Pseudomonas juntendi]WEA23714.1 helix-turn-helix domain-containing protein [Pseudomonas juntendi]